MISKMDKNADRVVRHARVRKKCPALMNVLVSMFTEAISTSMFRLSTTLTAKLWLQPAP